MVGSVCHLGDDKARMQMIAPARGGTGSARTDEVLQRRGTDRSVLVESVKYTSS